MGKCPDCGTWDSLEKFTPPTDEPAPPQAMGAAAQWLARGDDPSADGAAAAAAGAVPLDEVSTRETPRIATGVAELDRVLGGGIVPGSAVLFGGDPGIGKSTLLLQAAARLADVGRRVLYVSSEESAQQVKLRAERVIDVDDGADRERSARSKNLYVLSETNITRIAEQARRVQPELLVIDSIQMLWSSGVEAAPGSVTQLRRACLELVWLAKASNMCVALVGHVTKEGELAGPKLLEHLVDVVLQFEGDRHHAYRVVRPIKNRFGSTQEIGLFEMTGAGLIEVREGSLTLTHGDHGGDEGEGGGAPTQRPGTVFVPSLAGSRCLIAEIQALTATSFLGAAKRRASGLDSNRLAMLIAVLEKHGGLRLADQDVFAQAAGGMKIVEPAADVALALAIAGAHYARATPVGFAAIGEVGLTGEVRAVRQIEQRVAEIVRRGGRMIAVPASQAAAARSAVREAGDGTGENQGAKARANTRARLDPLTSDVEIFPVRSIGQAIDALGTSAPVTRKTVVKSAISP